MLVAAALSLRVSLDKRGVKLPEKTEAQYARKDTKQMGGAHMAWSGQGTERHAPTHLSLSDLRPMQAISLRIPAIFSNFWQGELVVVHKWFVVVLCHVVYCNYHVFLYVNLSL